MTRGALTTPYDVVRAHAERAPDRDALTFGTSRWTYAALADEAERAAGGLRALGLGPGDRLAVLAGNRPEVALAWLAGSRCGVVPCLLNNRLTTAELGPLLARLRPDALIVDRERLDSVSSAAGVAGLDVPVTLIEDGGDDAPAVTARWSELAASARFDGPSPPGADVFEITFTSGTTSQAKMVALGHEAEVLHWSAVGRNLGLDAADTVVVATPLFHSSGIRNASFVMWTAGGCVALQEGFSPSRFWRQAAAAGGTWSCFVETMLVLLLKAADGTAPPQTMRFVVGGGPPETVEAFESHTGVRVLHAYGMTECGMAAATRPDVDAVRMAELRRRHPAAMLGGPPTDGTRIRAVAEDGTDAAPGTPGELVVQGPGLLAEYVDDPAATAAAVPDGWLRTGDLGLVDADGTVYFVDRARDVIRRGGENIASKEVEAVLDAHPGVLRSAAYPVPDPIWVQEVGAVVLLRDHEVSVEDLWAWCEQRLAGYKVPRYLDVRSDLPTTATGRVNKALLRAHPTTPTTRDRNAVPSTSDTGV